MAGIFLDDQCMKVVVGGRAGVTAARWEKSFDGPWVASTAIVVTALRASELVMGDARRLDDFGSRLS